MYQYILFVSDVLYVVHVLVCINMYCLYYMYCMYACIVLYWYVLIVWLVWWLYCLYGAYRHVLTCIDLYSYVLMCIMYLLIQCLFFISQYMPIHTNTYQYGWHTKYWIKIRAQYFHACINCISMYWFFKYKLNTCKYKPIQNQYKPNTFMTG